jgi:hypothetical protein
MTEPSVSHTDSAGDAPDPDRAVDLADYVRMLRELVIWSGSPPQRDLARRAGQRLRPPQVLSKSTLNSVFSPSRRRLNLDLVVAVVRALGLDEHDVDRWRRACVRVHAEAKRGGPVGVFRQLPADLPTFTGRDRELKVLMDSVAGEHDAPATVVIHAVEGMAGVGKTQLAIRAAHQLVADGRYGDMQLYVNLRGFDPERGDPHASLAYQTDALALQQRLGDGFNQVVTLGNIGDTLARLGRLEESAASLREAIEVATTAGHQHAEAGCWESLARTLRAQGLHTDAIEALEHARSLFAGIDVAAAQRVDERLREYRSPRST